MSWQIGPNIPKVSITNRIRRGAHFDLLYKRDDFIENRQVFVDDTEQHIDQPDDQSRWLAAARFGSAHGLKSYLEDPILSFPGPTKYLTGTVNYIDNFGIGTDLTEEQVFEERFVAFDQPSMEPPRSREEMAATVARPLEHVWRSRVDQRGTDDPIRTHMLGYVARDLHIPALSNRQQSPNSSTNAR